MRPLEPPSLRVTFRCLLRMTTKLMRRNQWLLAVALALAAVFGAAANGAKFFPDDPVLTIVDSQDASGVQEREIDLVYDTLENSFSWPGDRTPNVPAQNVNTIDAVPDSNWFTNRLGVVPVTVDDVVKGPGTGTGPTPGTWTVIAAKSDGVMPGFTVRDSAGAVWFIKFDPPGQRRRFKESDIRRLLRSAHRNADGTYRVLASKALAGRPVVRHHLLDFGSTIGSAGVYPPRVVRGGRIPG